MADLITKCCPTLFVKTVWDFVWTPITFNIYDYYLFNQTGNLVV